MRPFRIPTDTPEDDEDEDESVGLVLWYDGISSWLDPIKQLGNAVCPPLVTQLGNHLHSNIKDM